jgi:hypothetical protein
MWHAQVTSLTLRLYNEPGGYAKRDPFDAVMQVEMLGDGVAFIHAAHGQISLRQWRALARLLRRDHGVTNIQADRHGKDAAYNPDRADPERTTP